MKLLLVVAAHLALVVVFCAAIYLLMVGKPGLLIASVIGYSLLFSKMCLSSH